MAIKASSKNKKAETAKKPARSTVSKKTTPASKKAPKKVVGVLKKTVKKSTTIKSKVIKTVKKSAKVVIKDDASLKLVRVCVNALDEKKAFDIKVVYVGENSSLCDYFILATGTSEPHLRALRIALEKAISEINPNGRVRVQNEKGSGWCVVDIFDVIIHIFASEQRKYYNIEELLKSGQIVPLSKVL